MADFWVDQENMGAPSLETAQTSKETVSQPEWFSAVRLKAVCIGETAPQARCLKMKVTSVGIG